MLSRRHILKIAAASSAAASVAATGDLSPAQAVRALAQPLTETPFEPTADPRLDPVAFAEELATRHLNELTSGQATAERTRYYRARAYLLELFPALKDADMHHPFTVMDEAAHGIWSEAQAEGIRVGAAMENLRIAAVGQMAICIPCQGSGIKHKTTNPCPECKGHGSVPIRLQK